MAPRLHTRPIYSADTADTIAGTDVPIVYVDEVERALLLDLFGVNELASVAGAEDRTVTLSDRSELVCPAHGRTLKPDACRSCWLLDPTRPPT
jgi:hypothetical protein